MPGKGTAVTNAPATTPLLLKSAWFWWFVLLIAGHAAAVLASPHPPILQDYPDWVYQGVLFAKHITGHAAPGYVLKLYPVPNSLTTVGVGLFSLIVGWFWAAKLWIVLVLAALGFSCVLLLRQLRVPHTYLLPIYAASVIAGLDLWNGSINFQLSLAFFFLLLAHLLRPKASGAITSLLLLLCFFTHMLPCAAGLLALGALALQQRHLRRLWPVLPTLLAAAWYALSRDPGPAGRSPLHLLPAVLAVPAVLWWTLRPTPATQNPRTAALAWPPILPVPVLLVAVKLLMILDWLGPLNVLTSGRGNDHALWPAAPFLALAVLGLLASVMGAWAMVRSCVHISHSTDPRRFLAITALLLFTLFALLPSDALGVTGIDSRFLHLAIAAGLPMLALHPGRRLRALAWVAVVLGTFNLVQFVAVQFAPGTISVANIPAVLPGASPVAPALRSAYYDALRKGHFNLWIFPTAMFRQVP